MNHSKLGFYKHQRTNSVSKSINSPPTQPLFTNSSHLNHKLSLPSPPTGVTQIESPQVSCKSGCLFDLDSQQYLWKMNSAQKREIASLTKIMTCWVVIQYLRDKKLLPENQFFSVSKRAAEVGGTSAELQEGDVVSVWDLLHGLMLPSGNDAALCLAEGLGKDLGEGRKSAVDAFVEEMNRSAAQLRMNDTTYINPHGLSNKKHKSTCEDQILLIRQVVQDGVFRKLIEKRIYFCSVEEKDGWNRELFWQSTNKLLLSGFKGIKTGCTPQAGPCLASWYKRDSDNLLIVTLCSESQDERFCDSLRLVQWVKGREPEVMVGVEKVQGGEQ